MDAITIGMTKERARELWQDYKKHQHYEAPMNYEIARTYELIAKGRVIIKALESIVAAGLNADGLPKLALARADHPSCFATMDNQGGCRMFSSADRRNWPRENASRNVLFKFANGSFPSRHWKTAEALRPDIPLHLKPKRGLQNYHVLWEAEWTPVPTHDPYLLRRIGKADLWLVVAAWDLTEVERAVLGARMHG